jgi:hypothetical protein
MHYPLLILAAFQSANAWKPLDAVRMVGVERYYDAPASPISIARRGGQTMFYTSGGLLGALLGKERKETSSAQGVFTWLSVFPRHCLWLPAPSTAHYASMAQPVRFSLKDLTTRREVVEKSLNSSIVRFNEDRVGERDCFVLTLADRSAPSSRQEIWIDKETGIIVRRRDQAGMTDQYELRIEKINTVPEFTPISFSPPDDAAKIRGPVDPELLECVN